MHANYVRPGGVILDIPIGILIDLKIFLKYF
jgi:NADH:ubiquinone oxidoreductase subunit D